MSEKDTLVGEPLDTNNGEQVSSQPETEVSNGGTEQPASDEAEQERKEKERELARKGQLDKVPDWIKEEIRKDAQSEFDTMYSNKRDLEIYEKELPKIVRDNSLTAEEETAIKEEVTKLVEKNNFSHQEALDYATRGLGGTDIKKAVKIVNGSLTPTGSHQTERFNPVSLERWDSMGAAERKKYMSKSIELHGAVKYS